MTSTFRRRDIADGFEEPAIVEPVDPFERDVFGLERLNKEVKRRADVVGIFPNEASIVRLVGAVLMEANDAWQLQHRYLSLEALAEIAPGEDADKFALAPPASAPILTPRAA